MAIHINVLKDQNIIEVSYTPDEITKEDLADQRKIVADALSKNNIKNVLIDALALKRLPPVATVYDHNVSVASHSIFRVVKFAVVCNSIGQGERFLETSGVNRGVQIKCFTSKVDALLWLNNA